VFSRTVDGVAALSRALGIDAIAAPANRRALNAAVVIAVLAMLVRIVFWVLTNRYWEDALITTLHAENFANGLGLTHHRPGEPPLHGFTSPLSVLVPLVGDLMAAPFGAVGFGVDFLKLVSIPAAALTVIYVAGFCAHPDVRLPLPLAVAAMGYAAFEHHQILFGMAGMETQLSVLILVMSLYYAVAWKPVALGVSLGLCMLVRPDYGFWTIVVGGYGLFKAPRDLPKIVALAWLVYGPWIVFTFFYYGSPVPNTVVAKGLGYVHWWQKADAITFDVIKRHVWIAMAEHLHVLLGPTFAGHGSGFHVFFSRGPESWIGNAMFAFAAFGGLAAMLARRWVFMPLLGWCVVYSLYYVFLVPIIFTWYKMPYCLMLLLLSLIGIAYVTDWVASHTPRARLRTAFTVLYLGAFLSVLPWTFWTERQIQIHVEKAVRKQAGLYLAERMATCTTGRGSRAARWLRGARNIRTTAP